MPLPWLEGVCAIRRRPVSGPSTSIETNVDLVIPSMLWAVFDRAVNGKVGPVFRQNVPIIRGVLEYAG